MSTRNITNQNRYSSEDDRLSYELSDKEFKDVKKIYELVLLLYILKTNTNENKALSANQITDILNDFVIDSPISNDEGYDAPFSARTISRKLTHLVKLSAKEQAYEGLSSEILTSLILGGTVKTKNATSVEKKAYTNRNDKTKRQKRFYFEPSLASGDINMIIGSILSNRFLSQAERDYLVKRLQILHSGNNYTTYSNIDPAIRDNLRDLPTLPDKPKQNSNESLLPVDSNQLLAHIQILNDAIQGKHQIEVEYGTYDLDMSNQKRNIIFHAKSKSILNPYALMWNNGGYYLIAANIEYTNPTYYRVDRIISVKIHSKLNDKGELVYPRWKEIPETLKDFFTPKGKTALAFDSIAYANRYPSMRISQKKYLIDFQIECTEWSLQILIDAFGKNMTIEPSLVEHSASELDYNGKPQQFFAATVRNVQYDNARDFCLAHPQYLTVLGPEELVTEVKDILKQSVARLEHDSVPPIC